MAYVVNPRAMYHIYEHASGLMLQIQYDPGPPVHFISVRLMNSEYQPVGPDMVDLLLDMAFLTRKPIEGMTTIVTPALGFLAEEIDPQP